MRRILFFILCLFFALQGYCDRVRKAVIHSQRIDESFEGEAEVKMGNGGLVLHKGNQSVKLYIETSEPLDYRVYQGNKLINSSELIKEKIYRSTIEQKGKKYILTINGGESYSKLKLSKRAKRYFNKRVPPFNHCSHDSHISHVSCYR